MNDEAWWRQNRFLFFVSARALSIIGDFAAAAALAIHIYRTTGSGLAISGFFVARILPRLFGAVAGALADRFQARSLLIMCDVLSVGVYLVIALIGPGYALLLVLVVVAESAATVSAPAARTLIARTVPASARTKANAAIMIVATTSMTLGSGIGGLTLAFGYEVALAINAASFLLSAVLLRYVPTVGLAEGSEPAKPRQRTRLWAEASAGVRLMMSDIAFAAVVLAGAGSAFVVAAARPALVILVEKTFEAGDGVYGLLLAIMSVGSLIAAVVAACSCRLTASAGLFAGALIVLAVGHLGIGGAPTLAFLVPAIGVVGLASGLRDITSTTLLQGFSHTHSIGVAIGAAMSLVYLADAFGSLAGGALTQLAGPRAAYLTGGVLLLGIALFTYLRAGRRAQAGEVVAPARMDG